MTMIAAAASQKRSGRPFIIKVNHTAGFTVTLPLVNGYNYNFIVDWGDGTVGQVTSATDTDRVHTYSSGGTYTIKMTGTLEGWVGNTTGMKEYIVEVTQWGRTGFKSVTMYSCTRLVGCYGKLITSQTTFNNTFEGCSVMTTCEVGDWDMSGKTSLSRTFWNCGSLTSLDVSLWDISNCTNLAGTFYECGSLTSLDVSNWNVTKVITFEEGGYGTFWGCRNITSFDVSGWVLNTTSNVVFNGVFGGCQKLTTIGDISGWNTSKVSSFANTFSNCHVLSSSTFDPSGWNVSNSTSFGGMFSACRSFTSLDLSAWTFKPATNINMAKMFYDCRLLTTIGATTSWATKLNFSEMFYNCYSLNYLDVSNWDTSGTTATYWAFYNCYSLTSLDVSGWDVSNIITWNNGGYGCFYGCTGLTSLDVSSWIFSTTKGISFVGVFTNCSNLQTLDVSGWNTEKFTTLQGTFSGCVKLTTLNVSSWVTTALTNTIATFKNCQLLTSIDISGWNMSNVTADSEMFNNCWALTSLTLPASLSLVQTNFATVCSALTVYNFYQATAPTVSGTPFSDYAKPLHVPASNSGYDVAPWTNTAIFSSIINDL